MDNTNIDAVMEAVLFASGEPLDPDKLSKTLLIDSQEIIESFDRLQREYAKDDHGIMILNLDGKYQMCSKSLYVEQVRTVLSLKSNSPLSNAAFEVLAIIAYNQPVTKSFVEQIRGVDCSGVISTLCQRNLIEERGRLDLPGRPLLYCTTVNFLRCFGIESLDELPSIPESSIEEPDENAASKELDGQMSLI